MKKAKIEIFRGKDKQIYVRFRARNGKIIAQSEGYKSLGSAKNMLLTLQNMFAKESFEVWDYRGRKFSKVGEPERIMTYFSDKVKRQTIPV